MAGRHWSNPGAAPWKSPPEINFWGAGHASLFLRPAPIDRRTGGQQADGDDDENTARAGDRRNEACPERHRRLGDAVPVTRSELAVPRVPAVVSATTLVMVIVVATPMQKPVIEVA